MRDRNVRRGPESRLADVVIVPGTLRRLAAGTALGMVVGAASASGWSSPIYADRGSTDSGNGGAQLAGYTATVGAFGVQVAIGVPGLLPVPGNLVEGDAPYVHSTVSDGPVVNALGAPYYPGNILANLGSLISEFASSSPFPNDPLLAEAEYPPSPGHGSDASFGGAPPPGSPVAPNVFSATSHAGADGSSTTATLTGIAVSPPSSPSSAPVSFGAVSPPSSPSPASVALAGPAPPAPPGNAPPGLQIASVAGTNTTSIGPSAFTVTAEDVLKSIEIAGVVSIGEVDARASVATGGDRPSPTSSLHALDVSVDGQPAYIDNQGVHVTGTTVAPDGVTPQQAQQALDETFTQDGISVRLLDPTTGSDGAQGSADSGGIVVTFTHAFVVPFVPGEPTVPVPGLGSSGLPAGTYTGTTTVTLAEASAVAEGTQIPAFAASIDQGAGIEGFTALGTGATGFPGGLPGADESLVASPDTGSGGGSTALGTTSLARLPLGIPAPIGWIAAALALCAMTTYPLLRIARWQFLTRPRR